MNQLNTEHNKSALKLLQAHDAVFIPIQKGQKIPLQQSWAKPDVIPSKPQLDAHLKHGGNLGLRLDQFLVVDVDVRDRAGQDEAAKFLQSIFAFHGISEKMLVSRSGSDMGGQHFIFRTRHPVNLSHLLAHSEEKTEQGQWVWSIALYSGHRHQIVLPPSIHPSGKGYQFLTIPNEIPFCPDSWLELSTYNSEQTQTPPPAESYPYQTLPPTIRAMIESGLPRSDFPDRDIAYYQITSACKQAGFTKEETLALYLDPQFTLSQKGMEKRGPSGAQDWIWKYAILGPWAKTTAKSAAETFTVIDGDGMSAASDRGETTAPPPPTPRKYLTHIDELGEPEDDDALVEGLIKNRSFNIAIGEPNVGKSFFALGLALSIARGVPFLNRNTEQGAVAYLALEGLGGLKARVKAYKAHHDLPLTGPTHLPFHLWEEPIAFGENPQALNTLIEALKPIENLRLVVVDTLARSIDGDENSANDMGNFIKAMDRIKDRLNTAVLVIHHTGKNKNGPRGSSALFGAVDTCIELTENRFINATKQRDMGKSPKPLLYALKTINLGVDKKGRTLESCVIILESEKNTPPSPEAAFSPGATIDSAKADASKSLARAIEAYDAVVADAQLVDPSFEGGIARYQEWEDKVMAGLTGEIKAKQTQVRRAKEAFKRFAKLKKSGSGVLTWYLKK